MKLRLVKVIVQPHFVVEDEDGNLSEATAEPVNVTAKDWPTYASEGFVRAVEALEAALTADDHEHTSANKNESGETP